MSLVGVFYEALILRLQRAHHGIIGLVHCLLDILGTLGLRGNGLVYGEAQRMPYRPPAVAHTGHHIERAVDGEGADGQLQLISQHEGSSSKLAHVPRKGACSLREDHQRHASLQNASRFLVSGAYLAGARLIYKDVMGSLAGYAHKGYVPYLLLHHPLEVAVKEAIDNEDIEDALMVGHKHIALTGGEILPTLYMYGQQEHPHDNPGPPLSGIIAPEMGIAYSAAHRGEQRREYGSDEQYGHCHKQLIDTIDVLHNLCNVMTAISGVAPSLKLMTPPSPDVTYK